MLVPRDDGGPPEAEYHGEKIAAVGPGGDGVVNT